MLVLCQSQRVPELPDIHTTTISKRYGRDPNHGMAAIRVLAGALTSTHDLGLIPQPNKPPSPLTANNNQQHNIDEEQRR
jgi:hypothetical protein